MAKKGPKYYDCNERQSSCTRKDADPRKGCPTCEYTIQYKYFIAELTKELKRTKGVTAKGDTLWPLQHLLSTITEVAALSGTIKGRDPNWTVVSATLVSIYRDEKQKIQSAENYATLHQPVSDSDEVNDKPTVKIKGNPYG